MYKIKYANGAEIPYNKAVETEEHYNGSARRTLTFDIDPSAVNVQTLADINGVEDNTKIIELENTETGITNVYNGYVLLLSCGLMQRYNDEDGTTTQVVCLKLGKRTYIEEKLHELGII